MRGTTAAKLLQRAVPDSGRRSHFALPELVPAPIALERATHWRIVDQQCDRGERVEADSWPSEPANHPKQGGVVTLEREDGTTVEVPIAKLADEDAAWAREEVKRRAGRK